MYVTEAVPEGYTEIRVTEILMINNTHGYVMETASVQSASHGDDFYISTGNFFTRLFVATVTGSTTDVLGKRSDVQAKSICCKYRKSRWYHI